ITTLVAGHPRAANVACGGTAVFSVVPTAGLTGLTYQWRRNLVPLTNSGHVTGATSQTLSINNACNADEGYYDVVLSDGTILEPSQLAQLSISTVSGAETPSEGPQPAFSIRATGPNPTSGPVSFRYNSTMPRQVTIGIYSATGARIRTLVRGMASGSGTVTWDGNLESGARASAGIYFLRVEAGSMHESRKIVLVR
ncbi:MAG: FlgD immunoglobulin-like domain containing protein, partial [Candidatus Eiseniibacteriota bacterium]